ncbi:MAG: ABC transporter permease [Solirubrobacteraceae bacterium]
MSVEEAVEAFGGSAEVMHSVGADVPGVARRHGPTAFGDDLARFFNLTLTLARTEFKLRYFGSVLGYVWSLMRPLLFFGVLFVVYTQIFKLGTQISPYPVYLLTSIILWTFFVEATTASVNCLIAREGLLRKMRFPRLVIPLSVALTALFNLCMNFIVVLVFALVLKCEPRLEWLELLPLVVLVVVLAVGVASILSVLYVRFRDILPIWEVVAQILFYGSPVIYVAAEYRHLHHGIVRYMMWNPLATIFTQMGKAFVDPKAPSAASYLGSDVRLLIPLAIIAAIFGFGIWFFNREAPRIAENI